jgi:hypothetical protein
MQNHPEQPWYGGGTLAVRWADGGFDLEVPGVNYGFTGLNLLADGTDPAADTLGAWRGYRLGEGVEKFRFAEGTTYSLEEVLEHATVVARSAFPFARASGDQVIDMSWSSVDFASDISVSEVSGWRETNDLVFQLADGSAKCRIVDWYADPATVPQMSFAFADGTLLDTDAVTRLGLTWYGTADFDYFEGDPDFANALYGLGGGDNLVGGAGNDVIDPGAPGGFGSYLTGGAGDDVYLFAPAYGNVTILEGPFDDGAGLDTVR